MPLRDKLRQQRPVQPAYPLWRGPAEDGITYSLLSRFLCCRERFRLLVVEGLTSGEGFHHRAEYGNMWHVCEEALARGKDWDLALKLYCTSLARRHPTQAPQIDHWWWVCRTQFPLYLEYWAQHPDTTARYNLVAEHTFNVPYRLPSRRVVRLRGKWDSVDLIGSGNKGGIYLQENKTKGTVNEGQLKRQLTFDLQTMLYLVALQEFATPREPPESGELEGPEEFNDYHIQGVRYNVVRRPLSGGKGSITRHKARGDKPEETKEHFYGRLAQYIVDEPHEYFYRWKVEVHPPDIRRFRNQCLDPILEQLCDWWEWVEFATHEGKNLWDNDVSFGARPDQNDNGRHSSAIHWRHPFGVYNVLDEGGSSELDEYLHSGSTLGLGRVDTLFPELT